MTPADLASAVYYALAALSVLISGAAGVFAWSAKQAVKNANASASVAKIDPMLGRIDTLERENGILRERQRGWEKELAALPTRDALHNIELALVEVKGQIGAIGAETKSIAASAASAVEATNRLEEFFIEKGVKK